MSHTGSVVLSSEALGMWGGALAQVRIGKGTRMIEGMDIQEADTFTHPRDNKDSSAPGHWREREKGWWNIWKAGWKDLVNWWHQRHVCGRGFLKQQLNLVKPTRLDLCSYPCQLFVSPRRS